MPAPTPTCALCGCGPFLRQRLGVNPPALRCYVAIAFSLDDNFHHRSTLHLHDNCIVEYLDANPSIAIAHPSQP